MSEISFSPRNFFVGDIVVGVYTFSSNSLNLPSSLEIADLGENFDTDTVTLHSIKITGDQNSHKIEFEFTPWKSGTLEIPTIDFSLMSDASGILTLPKITVDSIIRATQRNEIQPPRDPVLMPGTTTLLYTSLCIFSVSVCLILWGILKGRKLPSKFRAFLLQTFKSREFKLFIKGCKSLEKPKNKFTPKEFFEKLNFLTRTYLQNHFNKSFLSTVSSKVQTLFDEFYRSSYEEHINAVSDLCQRSDFVRFSPDSPEVLEDEERFSTLKRIKTAILAFEDGKNV